MATTRSSASRSSSRPASHSSQIPTQSRRNSIVSSKPSYSGRSSQPWKVDMSHTKSGAKKGAGSSRVAANCSYSRRTVSTLSWDTSPTLVVEPDRPPPPLAALRKVHQSVEVARNRRRLDPTRGAGGAGAAVVVGHVHGEVGEERLQPLERPSAPVGRAALDHRVQQPTVERRRHHERRGSVGARSGEPGQL